MRQTLSERMRPQLLVTAQERIASPALWCKAGPQTFPRPKIVTGARGAVVCGSHQQASGHTKWVLRVVEYKGGGEGGQGGLRVWEKVIQCVDKNTFSFGVNESLFSTFLLAMPLCTAGPQPTESFPTRTDGCRLATRDRGTQKRNITNRKPASIFGCRGVLCSICPVFLCPLL